MDFSFFGFGVSFSAEASLSSGDAPLEYKLLFSGENSLNGQKAEGFLNAFRNAMSGQEATGLPEGELPVVLPLAGKPLPDSTNLALENMEDPADFGGLDALPSWQDWDAEPMPEESSSGMFSLFVAGASPIQTADRPVTLPGTLSEADGRQASRLSVEDSMRSAVEEVSLAGLDPGSEGQRLSLPPAWTAASAKEVLLAESRNGPFPGGPAQAPHDLPRTPATPLATAGAAPGWREAGMPGEDSLSQIIGTRPPVSRQEIVPGETGGHSALSAATASKEMRPQMAGDKVLPEVQPGRSREGGSLAAGESLKREGTGSYLRNVTAHAADAGPARLTAEAFSRPAMVLPPVGAIQAGVSHSRLSGTGDGNAQVVSRGRDPGVIMAGNPSFQLQVPEKKPAESMIRPAAISSNTDNRPDVSLSALVLEDGDGGGAAMGARQVSMQTAAMPASGTAGVLPRQTEINVPLGHAAWEQSLARQLLQAGQGQLRQLHIKLNPSNLGSLDIKLQMEGDSASIAFSSQHVVVREAVEASLPRLREMFSGSGINLGNVDVGGQDTARGQQSDARSSGFSPGHLFGGGEDEQGGVMDTGRQSRKGKDDNKLLDYYV